MPEPLYDYVSVPSVNHSNFDLSFAKYLTTDFFRLVPILCKEAVTGDTWTIGNRIVVRFQPMFAPVLADISIRVHYFFTPLRLLWNRDLFPPAEYTGQALVSYKAPDAGFNCYAGQSDVIKLKGTWADFFRGVITINSSTGELQDVNYLQPRAIPSTQEMCAKGTLWDYFGFPTYTDNGTIYKSISGTDKYAPESTTTQLSVSQSADEDNYPTIYPFAAYNLIFNEYYRDENYCDYRALNAGTCADVAYRKDYFTSALPYQQKGESIALPVSSELSDTLFTDATNPGQNPHAYMYATEGAESTPRQAYYLRTDFESNVFGLTPNGGSPQSSYPSGQVIIRPSTLNEFVKTAGAVTSSAFDITDLRFAFQVQKFLERSARCGTRYTEFLRAHFAEHPRDERLQRPEYIGGSKQPIIISEVLQTGATESGSPQGNMAGHAISVDSGFIGKYHVTEPGIIMGLMSITPKAHYQQGIHKSWLRRSRYDYFFHEFENLSEQGVEQEELYFTSTNDVSHDKKVIGYQGRYNELRMSNDEVSGDFRDILDFWHLGRKFSSAPAINKSFIYGSHNDTKRIFAVQNEDPILCSFGNLLKVSRPMVKYPEPGLIDHH